MLEGLAGLGTSHINPGVLVACGFASVISLSLRRVILVGDAP